MNYLGHQEFGLNYQSWNLPVYYKDTFSINHWLEQWYLFYDKIIKNLEKNKNILLIPYDEICRKNNLVEKLVQKTDITKNVDVNFFKFSEKEVKEIYERNILLKCADVFEKMKNLDTSLNNL
jgi:hypothetical protein